VDNSKDSEEVVAGRCEVEKPVAATNDATKNIVDFPPAITDGQREWDRRLASQLLPYLPEDPDEAREIVSTMSAAINRFEEQREWEKRRLACYILGMFPEDRRAAQRLVRLLSGFFDGDDAA